MIGHRLSNIERLLSLILKQESAMAIDLTKITNDVAALTSAVASAEALITAMADEIKSISGSTTDATTQAALDNLATQLENNTAGLAAAVAANTPAAPSSPAP